MKLHRIAHSSIRPSWLGFFLAMGALILPSACTLPSSTSVQTHTDDLTIRYATLLKMEQQGDITMCTIYNPWNPKQILQKYALAPWDTTCAAIAGATIIHPPLKRNAITNACHAYLINELDRAYYISVLCEAEYVKCDSIRRRLELKKIANGGNSVAPDLEVILSQRTDAIWVAPYENCGIGSLAKLHLPIIYGVDYMETDPLARAEWMRFYGRLVGRGAQADSLFRVVEANYKHVCKLVRDDTLTQAPRPTILSEHAIGATWYVPGGCSSMGLLYEDAGGNYLWNHDNHAGSLSLSPESVLNRGQNSDLWFLKYYDQQGDWTLESFLAQHPYYKLFRPAHEGHIYACNSANNGYFEVTPFRPDILLRNLYELIYAYRHTGAIAPTDSVLMQIPEVHYFNALH